MNHKKNNCGFTLIELLLSMLALSILIMMIGLILIQGWKSWNLGQKVVEMQRGASLAYTAITKEVRVSSADQISAGSTLVCSNTNGVTRFSQSGNRLIASGNIDVVLIDDGVTGFSSINTNGVVTVNMTLNAGGLQQNKTFIITPRN